LTEAGALVTVGVRHQAAFENVASSWGIRAEVLPFDALDAGAPARIIADAAPGVVFNLVGYGVDRSETDPDLMARMNEELVRQVAVAVSTVAAKTEWSGRRLVHAGSALEYGLVEGVVTEDGSAAPHTDYGRTKLAGTNALRDVATATGLSALTARAFTVVGPGEHAGRLLPTIQAAATSQATVRLSAGTQLRDFAYVEDVAEGLLRLGLSSGAPGEVVNLATGRLTTVRKFAKSAARVLGLPANRMQFGAEPIRPDEMRITGVDVGRLRELTGWTPPAELDSLLRRAAGFEARLARDSHTRSSSG
jgi:nucleoside-diphosphate-sugar epimerase